jgi:hypothetical protein
MTELGAMADLTINAEQQPSVWRLAAAKPTVPAISPRTATFCWGRALPPSAHGPKANRIFALRAQCGRDVRVLLFGRSRDEAELLKKGG